MKTPYALTIHYSTIEDLRERLHDLLEGLEVAQAEVRALPALEDVPMADIVSFLAKQGYALALPAAETSVMAVAETDVDVQDANEPVDPEAFKAASIERLKNIYTKKGGAMLIDRLIKQHGGGATLFTKVDASRFEAIMAEVDKEFPNV